MPLINQIKIETTVDGRKVATIQFTPQVPNPASQADVLVVFEVVQTPSASLLGNDACALVILSSTLTDTRETYALSREQQRQVIEAVIAHITENT